MIIPGDHFDPLDHPFDVPVMEDPGGYFSAMSHIDRKFWAFAGPFERFLYLDADIICVRNFSGFLNRLENTTGKFIYANVYHDPVSWTKIMADPGHPDYALFLAWVRRGLGRIERLLQFDPLYNPLGRSPFNAGLFASGRHVITEKEFEDLEQRERKFYDEKLGGGFSAKADALFYADQGRLNYLTDRLGLRVLDTKPEAEDIWSGDLGVQPSVDEVERGVLGYAFIHWAGRPRPSPSYFCVPPWYWLLRRTLFFPLVNPEQQKFHHVAGYHPYRRFARQAGVGFDFKSRLKFSAPDARRVASHFKTRLKAKWKNIFRKE
jgi:hypothetical protein